MKKFFLCLWKSLLVAVYLVLVGTITTLAGCRSVTPTRKPPLVEKIGYKIPNYKGWTFVGINESFYKMELQKMKLLAAMIETVNAPALAAREQAINWFNVGMSAGMFGGIPLALKRLPKGAAKKEDYEKAGLQDPEEFKKGIV